MSSLRHGTVTCTVEAANGKPVYVSLAVDLDSDTLSSALGSIESNTFVFTCEGVPAGNYVVSAIVYYSGEVGPPQSGDYMGWYGVESGTALEQLVTEVENVVVSTSDLDGVDFPVWMDYALLGGP